MRSPSRMLLEIEVRRLVLQIGLRERGLTVQRRLERHHDLDYHSRVGGDGGCGEARSMSTARYVIRDLRSLL